MKDDRIHQDRTSARLQLSDPVSKFLLEMKGMKVGIERAGAAADLT